MSSRRSRRQALFDSDGLLVDPGIEQQLDIMAQQVVTFAKMKAEYAAAMARGQAETLTPLAV